MIADERQGAAVGRPDRGVIVSRGVEHARDLVGGEIEAEDAVAAEALLESQWLQHHRSKTVGAEGEHAPIGRPAQLLFVVGVVGEPRAPAPAHVHQPDVGAAVHDPRDRDRVRHRGPRGERQRVTGQIDARERLAIVHPDHVQHVAPTALRGEGDPAALGRPGERAAKRGDGLEVDVALAANHAALQLAVESRHDVDVGVLASVGEVGDAVALGRDRGSGVEVALVAPVVGQPAGEALRALFLRHRRPVFLAQPFAPLLVELLFGHPDAALEGAVEIAGLTDALEHVAHPLLAVAVGEVGERGLALFVDQVATGVLERRQVAIDDAVADEHLGVGLHAEREVLGHALGEPQGHREERLPREQRRRRAAVEEVEHEGVGQLVDHDVPQVLVGPGEGQHHPVAQDLGEPAGAGVDQLGCDVGLGEVVVGAVEDDRHAAAEGVPHALGQHRMGLLGEVHHPHRQAVEAAVEIDLEVVRGHRTPVVGPVLDLVLAEILGVRGAGDRGHGRQRQRPSQRASRSPHRVVPFLSARPSLPGPHRPAPESTPLRRRGSRPPARPPDQYSHRALRLTLNSGPAPIVEVAPVTTRR